MFVIEWLASYLQEMQLPEKALTFYQKAQMLQPEEPKWTILMAHAYRRMGNYSQALQTFQKV
jgi:intraflagellar transport protein 88